MKKSIPGWCIPAAVALIALLPFVNRAFHIDDAGYLVIARHIAEDPVDFYGVYLNWLISEEHLGLAVNSPPLQPYYLALIGCVVGWQEYILHLAMLPFTLAAVIAAYRIAQRFCQSAQLASLLLVVSPGFLVSAAGLMLDVVLLAFFSWSIVVWMEALEKRSHRLFVAAALLVAAAYLTKFYGVALLPLLGMYTLTSGRKNWTYTLYLLIPLCIMVLYEAWTTHLYGQGHLQATVGHTNFVREVLSPPNWYFRPITSIVFIGGCVSPLIFLAPVLWGWKRAAMLAAATALVAILSYNLIPDAFFELTEYGDFARLPQVADYLIPVQSQWWHHLQWAVFLLAGMQVLLLALRELTRLRDPKVLLLLAWLAGTFCFAVWINHLLNARILLPMTIPIAILIMRRIEEARHGRRCHRPVAAAAAMSLALSLAVCYADSAVANLSRSIAPRMAAITQDDTLWFANRGGLHHYIEQEGGQPIDWFFDKAQAGDWYLAHNNSWPLPFVPKASFAQWNVTKEAPCAWMSVQNNSGFSGFYGIMSPLPFSFGPALPEQFCLVQFRENFRYADGLPDAPFREVAEIILKQKRLGDPSIAEGVFE